MKLALLIGVAILCGAAQAIQAQFTGTMQRQAGALESTFITYFSGGMVVALVMLAARGGNLSAARGLPWYVWTAGIFGLIIIGTLSLSVGQLGLVETIVIATVSQFVVGAVINHFGLLGAAADPIDLSRMAGFALLGVGTFLVLR